MLTEDSVPAIDRERLVEITDQLPLVIRRTRNAAALAFIAAGFPSAAQQVWR